MTDQSEAESAFKNAEKMRGRPFEAGHPGGPGRPMGSRNKATLILDALAEGEAEEILSKTIEMAKQGDLRAAEIILSRIWPPGKGRPVSASLPKIESAESVFGALTGVLEATAEGNITPDEAAQFAGLLEATRKAIETVNLEERIARLEEKSP